MTQTEEATTITTTYNGVCTLTWDDRTGTWVWRNATGGRVSRFWANHSDALRFPPS